MVGVRGEDFTLVQDDDGRWHVHGTLSAESGATLAAALDPLSAPEPASDDVPDLVSPPSLAVFACGAEVSPVLVDSAGSPLDVGRTVYAFPDRTRRAIIARDQHCTFRGCHRPPAWCQAHHVVSYAEGDATSEREGVLLCGFHHRLVHRQGWRGELRGSQVV